MSHEVHRLLGSIYNRPHLILDSAMHPILDYLTARNTTGIQLAIAPQESQVKIQAKQVNKVGEIKIDSALTYRPVMALCGAGGTSYQEIIEQCSELISLGVNTIILTHSSPGGEAQMAFDCANTLRSLCDESNVRLISYVETMAASASYLIACISDEVVCHPEAAVGSIGAMIAIVDRSKAMADAGIKPIFLSSTPGKIPFDSNGSFTEKFINRMQKEVTELGTKFAQHVSNHTGMSLEDVISLDAEMFNAEEAKRIGLINSIMTHKQFAAYIAKPKGNK